MSEMTSSEKAIYEWQVSVPGFGEEGQRRLKYSSALVSRVGGLGGSVAQLLAAAGIGRLVLAHGGNLKPSDLNRQILMTHDWLGKPRVECAARRLRELNPYVEIDAVPENINEGNVAALVSKVDIVFDCAPLFSERFLMNRECVSQGKPLIDSAVFSMEGRVITIIPGKSACLACLYPEDPPHWKRKFPVFGGVSTLAASIAAMEGIKLLSGMGANLAGQMLIFDSIEMAFRKISLARRSDCSVCGHLS
jgi:molybdopterin/thiamine biosynthesis adenylyltransferase